MKLIVNQKLNSGDWRRQLYTGSFFLWTNIKSAHVLGDWAEECINKFFNSDSWRGDYLEWSKDMFIDRVQGLKSHFTNSEKTKDLVSFVKLRMLPLKIGTTNWMLISEHPF